MFSDAVAVAFGVKEEEPDWDAASEQDDIEMSDNFKEDVSKPVSVKAEASFEQAAQLQIVRQEMYQPFCNRVRRRGGSRTLNLLQCRQ